MASLPVRDDVLMPLMEALVQIGAAAKQRRQAVRRQAGLACPLPCCLGPSCLRALLLPVPFSPAHPLLPSLFLVALSALGPTLCAILSACCAVLCYRCSLLLALRQEVGGAGSEDGTAVPWPGFAMCTEG
jgi:hypothetical protein